MSDVQNINVTVAGGYEPSVINLKQGVPAQITFTRTSTQGCLDVVHSNALNFETALPIDEPRTVMIPTKQAGEFNFSCGMDMFHGTIHIK